MTRGCKLVATLGLAGVSALGVSSMPTSGQVSLSGHIPKLDGDFSEADMWRLVASRARRPVNDELEDAFGGDETRWTPDARAVYDLVFRSSTRAEAVDRLLARYVREANADVGKGETVAFPIPGLYPVSVERLLLLIEGSHLWRARGREKLAKTAADEALELGATLSDREHDIREAVKAALAAPIRYVPTFQEFPVEAYWPGNRASDRESPRTIRWTRGARDAEGDQEFGDDRPVTRRVGGSNSRWWPAYQEAYLDLAYRGLPELLRRRLMAPGQLGVFRVWHAGFEDGSQTFLLAALLDEAMALLTADPDLADTAAAELSSLRLEIIATDYAYMPNRRGSTYRFDAAGWVGSGHHKWNLVLEESALADGDHTDLVDRLRNRARKAAEHRTGTREEVPEQAVKPISAAERQVLLRGLADQGLVGALLGRFLGLAPEIEVPLGAWDRPNSWGFVKHAYRLIDRSWKVVELREGVAQELFNVEVRDRLIRFEQGDMTEALPSGFERDAFDLLVVTNVLPYIYSYYDQQGEHTDRALGEEKPPPKGKVPMERAQDNVLLAARRGAWVLMDERTEREALYADKKNPLNDKPDLESWTRSWVTWVRSLSEKQVELYLTLESGAELRPSSGYQPSLLGSEAQNGNADRQADD